MSIAHHTTATAVRIYLGPALAWLLRLAIALQLRWHERSVDRHWSRAASLRIDRLLMEMES